MKGFFALLLLHIYHNLSQYVVTPYVIYRNKNNLYVKFRKYANYVPNILKVSVYLTSNLFEIKSKISGIFKNVFFPC